MRYTAAAIANIKRDLRGTISSGWICIADGLPICVYLLEGQCLIRQDCWSRLSKVDVDNSGCWTVCITQKMYCKLLWIGPTLL